jgi:hypothetical protein
MKHLLTIAMTFYCLYSFSQYGPYSQFAYFDEFLRPKTVENKIRYIDSIKNYTGDNKTPVSLQNKFISKSIDDNYNINEGEYYEYSANENMLIKAGDLQVNYKLPDKIHDYLFLYSFYYDYDTMKYLLYREDDKILIDQEREILWCSTGHPADGRKSIYKYNENGDITNKLTQLKWNYETNDRPFYKWTDAYDFNYTYDDKKVTEIFYKSYDFDKKEWVPWSKELYSYKNNKLIEFLLQNYNVSEQMFVNYYIDYFSDSLDMKVKERYFWENGNWKPTSRIIKTQELYPVEITQIWNFDSLKWVNRSRSYKKHSGLFDFENRYYEYWDIASAKWKSGDYIEYSANGDTIICVEGHFPIDESKNIMVFNNGNIQESKYYIFFNNKWYLKSNTIFKYDSDNNLIRKDGIYSYNLTFSEFSKSVWEYFWHSNNTQNSYDNKFVNSKNQWNIGYRKDIFGPFYYTQKYKFSEDDTLINDKLFRELLVVDSLSNGNWKSTNIFFREKESKIWKFDNGLEYLYYDFSLEKGDTFITNNNELLLVILAYNKVMTNGEMRKTLKFFDLVSGGATTWIEGVGDSRGLLTNNSGAYIDTDWDLLCYYKDQELVYQNDIFSECWISGNSELDAIKVQIFPNPVSDYLEIDQPDSFIPNLIVIADLTGKKIMEYNNYTGKINVSKLNKGMYILKMIDRSGTRVFGKFIKTDK